MNYLYFFWVKKIIWMSDVVEGKPVQKRFNPGEVYIIPAHIAKLLIENIPYSHYEITPIFEFLKKYDHNEKGVFNIIIIRAGGIGDIVALSSFVYGIQNVTFITNPNNKCITDHFSTPVKATDLSQPIFNDLNFTKLQNIKRTWRIVDFGNAIEKGGRKNWYELFYESVNMPFHAEFGRPFFKSVEQTTEKTLLVVHKSSATMRTAPFILFYSAIKQISELNDYDILVHDLNINQAEPIPEDVKIISAKNTGEFIDQVKNAGIVISMDTGALHLREGFKLPAIGIYNSFTTDSRTKYYQYTYSFDLQTDCDLSPCFLHESKKGKFCPKNTEQSFFAPCMIGESISIQVVNGIKNGLKKLNIC